MWQIWQDPSIRSKVAESVFVYIGAAAVVAGILEFVRNVIAEFRKSLTG